MSKATLFDSRIKKYAYCEPSEIYRDIGASPDGLPIEQIESMREKYGKNSFNERKNDTTIQRLRRVFINPFHVILGMFQAGWFVESMWSQTLVIHMIRTPKLPFIQSRASSPVTLLTMAGIMILTIIPFTVLGTMLGFVALPATYFAYLIPCILLYMILATSLKKAYVRHFGELL